MYLFKNPEDLKPGTKITGVELRPIDAYFHSESNPGFACMEQRIITYKGEGLFEVVGKLRTWTCRFLTPFTYTRSL